MKHSLSRLTTLLLAPLVARYAAEVVPVQQANSPALVAREATFCRPAPEQLGKQFSRLNS